MVPVATVLLVESDPTLTYLIRRYAVKGGCRLVRASWNEEVQRVARCEKPAVILMDVAFPEVDGQGVLQALRADPVTCEIPVVVCAALDVCARYPLEGVDGFLRTPVLYRDFAATLESVGVKVQNGTGAEP